MKRLLLLILLLSGAAAQAQTHWQGFLPGRTAHYAVVPPQFYWINGLEAVYEPVRFDSNFASGPNQFYSPMKVRGTLWWSRFSQTNYPYFPGAHEHPWYGPIYRTDSSTEEYFPFAGGSIVLRRQRLHLGDTALAWLGGRGKLAGICTRLDTAHVLTETDSVATLTLVHLDSTGAAGAWNGRTLKLSRRHGWEQTLNFSWIEGADFVEADTMYRTLAFLSGSPVQYTYPPYNAWYDYQPGDVLQSSSYASRAMTAQCFPGPSCGGGLAAAESVVRHMRLLRRMAGPQGDSLVWVDSSQSVCSVQYPPMNPPPPVISPLKIDTTLMLIHERIDSSEITRLSFEAIPNPTSFIGFGMPLVRVSGKIMRIRIMSGLSGGGAGYYLQPFGYIQSFGNYSPQGQCSSSSSILYATCNGDTLGNLGHFTATRRSLAQAHLLTLFPNPTSGLISIQPITGKPITFQFIRADGAVLQTQTISTETKLNLSHLPSGLYAWRAVQGSEFQTGRIVKE